MTYNFEIEIIIYQDILRLEVSMNEMKIALDKAKRAFDEHR